MASKTFGSLIHLLAVSSTSLGQARPHPRAATSGRVRRCLALRAIQFLTVFKRMGNDIHERGCCVAAGVITKVPADVANKVPSALRVLVPLPAVAERLRHVLPSRGIRVTDDDRVAPQVSPVNSGRFSFLFLHSLHFLGSRPWTQTAKFALAKIKIGPAQHSPATLGCD